MNEFLSWIGWGAGALLVLAVVVAGWEQLVREASGLRAQCGAHTEPHPSVVSVDVRLDTQAAALAADSESSAEQATRLATMTSVLSRAAAPSLLKRDNPQWMDTAPRVLELQEPARHEPGSREDSAVQRQSRRG
jgi:hypothetical protein